jgi:hypothetical protein
LWERPSALPWTACTRNRMSSTSPGERSVSVRPIFVHP